MPGSLNLSKISTTEIQTKELRDLNDNVMMSDGVLSSIVKFPAGFPIRVNHFQGTETQQVYGSAGYDYYNNTYTVNSNQDVKLLIQYGIFYEMNANGDSVSFAVSIDGVDVGYFIDTQSGIEYNIWTTAQTITSAITKNTSFTLRLYIKNLSGNVVVPRNGSSPNWTLTITEIVA